MPTHRFLAVTQRFTTPGWTTLAVLSVSTLVLLAWRARAEDLRDLKPLPSFLRSATVADRYLSTREIAEVMQFERKEAVCLQLVKRAGVPLHVRVEALAKLAELKQTSAVAELLPWIDHWDQMGDEQAAARGEVLVDLAQLLPEQTRAELVAHRDRILALATQGKRSVTRRGAYAALIVADGGPDGAWTAAGDDYAQWVDVIEAVGWLPAEVSRQALDARLRPLVEQAPTTDVQRAAIENIGALAIQPQVTFDLLAELLERGVHPEACVRSICDIPSAHWTASRQRPLARAVIERLASLPLDQRTSPAAKQSLKLAGALAERLPADEAAIVRRELAAVTVNEIVIHTLEEKMAYDQTVLVVQRGQGVQIHFQNDDIMPHNLVFVDSPAAREEVGMAADQMQTEPGALAKGYLPDSPHILHATRLLPPKTGDLLTFTAPQVAGTYAYLCTFPGHWSKMYGALVVVDDVAAYLAANQPLSTADDLLGIKTVEWSLEQLVTVLPELDQGRSFENGQRQFLRASCMSCHQMQQQGGRIGPELTTIREKYKTPEELLRQIMLPSDKVEEKYATAIIETSSGEVLRGVIVSETADELQLNENPLASCEPKVLRKSDVEDVTRSKLSPMPEKLLNTLVEPGDVLDLLAYLLSGGNPQHDLYRVTP